MYTYKTPKYDLRTMNFSSIAICLGRIVNRYDVISTLAENYFISDDQWKGYELARAKQELNAHKKFGTKILIR
jgi:hypothetical protein